MRRPQWARRGHSAGWERGLTRGVLYSHSVCCAPLGGKASRSRPPRKKKKNQGEGGITQSCGALQRNRVHIWFPRIGTGERRQEGDSGWWLSCACVAILMQLDYAPTPGLYGRRQGKRPNQGKFPVMRLHITHPAWSKKSAFSFEGLRTIWMPYARMRAWTRIVRLVCL